MKYEDRDSVLIKCKILSSSLGKELHNYIRKEEQEKLFMEKILHKWFESASIDDRR